MKDSHVKHMSGSAPKTTPKDVMGSQGKPANLPAPQWQARPTGNKQFPPK